MNLVTLRKFTSTEIDLFFVMCNKLKEQGTRKIHISFKELRHLSNYYSRSEQRFVQDLERVYDKMLKLTYTERNEKGFKKFVLFTSYEVNTEGKYLEIAVNTDLSYILNSITSDFTKFELQEMAQLKSTYAKNMFRLLKQYKHTGYVKFSIEDFRERLDVPKSYRMTDLNKVIFNPIVKELGGLFNDLHINKIKAKKGRKIEYVEFVFEPEKRIHSNKQRPEANHQPYKNRYQRNEPVPQWLLEGKHLKRNPNPTYDNQDEDFIRERDALMKKLREEE